MLLEVASAAGGLVAGFTVDRMSKHTLSLLFALVTFVLGPLASPPELWPLGGICFLPLLLLLGLIGLNHPSPTRIFDEGIEVSLPLWWRTLGGRSFYPWDDVVNVYPASYEVSGAFLSPFASSAGTLVHTGVAIETRAGERRIVRFTPGAIRGFRGETEGYVKCIAAVRDVFRSRGRPLVTSVKRYGDDEVRAMAERAREPLVGMAAIVLAFLAPPIFVAGAFLALSPGPLAFALAIAGAAAPPSISIGITWRRSRRRSDLLSELSKFQESLRPPP